MPSSRASVIAAVSAALLLLAPAHGTAGKRPYVRGELLVKYKPSADSRSRGMLKAAARAIGSRTIGRSRIQRVILGPDTTVGRALAVYADAAHVEYAEPNYILEAQTIPDDEAYDLQWGLHNTGQEVNGYVGSAGADIDAQQAWDLTTGDASVVVAVVDTGCDLSHPDMAGNVWINPEEIAGNGIDDDGNGLVDDVHGWDFMDSDNIPQDAAGHGTHVAGVIAAAGGNGRGISGTAWNVRIMPLRFMNAFSQGTTADAIEAIQYAIDKGVRIINCSWGGSGFSTALYDTMRSAPALFVCAAGNSAVDLDVDAFYPAGFNADNVLSVTASDQYDRLCWFSNFSSTAVDAAAPGIRIYSMQNGRQTLWTESFDSGDPAGIAGWTTGGSGDTWGVGSPPGHTELTTLALNPGGNYDNNADTWVQAPVLDLSTATATVLTFHLIGGSEESHDVLYCEVSPNGNQWISLPLKRGNTILYDGISGTVPYFTTLTADLGPWDHAPQLHFRFRFQSNSSLAADGFYIDDIVVEAAQAQDSYRFMQGTSMAAGYVSGIAALIQSVDDDLAPLDVRGLIVDSVEAVDDLAAYTATGGRVNAYQALALQGGISTPDTSLERTGSGGGGGGGGCFIGSLFTVP